MSLNAKTAKCGGCGAVIPVRYVHIPKQPVDSDGTRLKPDDWTRVVECPNVRDSGAKNFQARG